MLLDSETKQSSTFELISKFTVNQILRSSKLDSLDTRLILAHTLNCSKEKLITNSDYELSKSEYQQFMRDYEKRIAGMPLSYILGYKEFYSRLFRVTKDTLIPRPETEFLVEIVIKLCKERLQHKSLSLLELGTGTGCIAISCKLEIPSLQVMATDNYPATLEVAETNAKTYDADIKFFQSDWYSNITGKFDFIVSNPPYIEVNDAHLADLSYEPQYALTDFGDGLSCIRQIVLDAPKYLKHEGYLILEHGYNQGEQVRQILSTQGFSNVSTILDYAGLERMTLGQYYDYL